MWCRRRRSPQGDLRLWPINPPARRDRRLWPTRLTSQVQSRAMRQRPSLKRRTPAPRCPEAPPPLLRLPIDPMWGPPHRPRRPRPRRPRAPLEPLHGRLCLPLLRHPRPLGRPPPRRSRLLRLRRARWPPSRPLHCPHRRRRRAQSHPERLRCPQARAFTHAHPRRRAHGQMCRPQAPVRERPHEFLARQVQAGRAGLSTSSRSARPGARSS